MTQRIIKPHLAVRASWRFAILFAVSALVSPSARTQNLLYKVLGPSTTNACYACAGSNCGDADGDGIEDFIVGAHSFTSTSGFAAGRATVYSGKNGSILYDIVGNTKGIEFGRAVDGGGDVDNDGFADFIVGAPSELIGLGCVRVYSGATGITLHKFVGEQITVNVPPLMGSYVGRAGDMNHDGFEDIAMQSWGRTFVRSGQTGALIHSWTADSTIWTGGNVCGGYDFNADSTPDLASIGGTVNPMGVLTIGTNLFSGTDGSLIRTLYAQTSTSSGYGRSLDVAPDIDLDGAPDVIVGSPNDNKNGTNSGTTWVYSGASGEVLYLLADAPQGSKFGHSVAGLDDLDGDGASDFVIGAPCYKIGGNLAGFVRVYSGKSGLPRFTIEGNSTTPAGPGLGWSVAGMGDINGDGISEFIAGAPWAQPGGEVLVYSPKGCAYVTPYGQGCPGSGNVTPAISAPSTCVGANQAISLFFDQALGGSTALLLLGLGQGAAPVGGGCSLLLAGVLPAAIAIPLGGSGPGGGSALLNVVVPPTTQSGTIFVQAFVADPGVARGFAATNGVSVFLP